MQYLFKLVVKNILRFNYCNPVVQVQTQVQNAITATALDKPKESKEHKKVIKKDKKEDEAPWRRINEGKGKGTLTLQHFGDRCLLKKISALMDDFFNQMDF